MCSLDCEQVGLLSAESMQSVSDLIWEMLGPNRTNSGWCPNHVAVPDPSLLSRHRRFRWDDLISCTPPPIDELEKETVSSLWSTPPSPAGTAIEITETWHPTPMVHSTTCPSTIMYGEIISIFSLECVSSALLALEICEPYNLDFDWCIVAWFSLLRLGTRLVEEKLALLTSNGFLDWDWSPGLWPRVVLTTLIIATQDDYLD